VSKPQKRRPERLRPGLKLQTPVETKETAAQLAEHRKRWEHLFSLNVFKSTR
jgi:hypothetical protein